ncbi:MAG: NUDIX domain-containing protein [Chloroflexi bacterium]|nr:NUDIX domain-containing protein [Chloroflexota bacterium]
MLKSEQRLDQKRYQVVPRTLIFLFDDQERVLLLKGAQNKTRWAGLYNGIGGHVERGEDIYTAAYRELFEEAGIVDVALHFCCQIIIDVSEQVGVMLFVFKGLFSKDTFKSSPEGTLSWINLDEIDQTPLVEDLPILIPRIAAYQAPAPVINAKYSYDENDELKILFS